MGGDSAERAVSLKSGQAVLSALLSAGVDAYAVDVQGCLLRTVDAPGFDRVFIALHGRGGEDGTLQAILSQAGIPFTGSEMMASALAMDKERTKAAYRAAGLPVVASVLAARDAVRAAHVMPPPYVVKPNNEGSSVGVYLVQEAANAPPVLSDDMPETVMVEAFAPGRELTTTVMGDRPLTVTDILTDGWYDYDAKYTPGGSRHVVPADVPPEIFEACMAHALQAHRVLGCRGLSRTDFRWDDTKGPDGLILLETNTQPGMTPTSLSPEQAQAVGISFPELCAWMVEDASCDR